MKGFGPVSFLHLRQLLLIAIPDALRRCLCFSLIQRPVHVVLIPPLPHQLQVLVSHNLFLAVFHCLLLALHLGSSQFILLNEGLVRQNTHPLLLLLFRILGIDELLGGLAELPLLLPMILQIDLVLQARSLLLAKHVISLTDLLKLFQLRLLCFLLHGLLQLLTVAVCQVYFLGHLVFAIASIGLHLALDYGAPFIDPSVAIHRIVSLIVVCEGVKFLTFIFEWLFHSLCVNLQ